MAPARRTTLSTLPKTPPYEGGQGALVADGAEPEGRGGPLPNTEEEAPSVSPVPLFDDKDNGSNGREAGRGEGGEGAGWPLGDWRSRIGMN